MIGWGTFHAILERELKAFSEDVHLQKRANLADLCKIMVPKKIIAVGLNQNMHPLIAAFSLRYFENGVVHLFLAEHEASSNYPPYQFLLKMMNIYRLHRYIKIYPKEQLENFLGTDEKVDIFLQCAQISDREDFSHLWIHSVRKGGAIWIDEGENTRSVELKKFEGIKPIPSLMGEKVPGLEVYRVI
ncbi:MAG: hypothetical protein ACOYK9_04415 [Chlamydiia bacterium]